MDKETELTRGWPGKNAELAAKQKPANLEQSSRWGCDWIKSQS